MREILVTILLCFAISCSLAFEDKCQQFTCSESPTTNTASCLFENSDNQEIIMSKCNFECKILLSDILTQDGQISYEKMKTQETCKSNTSIKSSERLKYSGEQCESNSQCYSNNCKNDLCIGASVGETCNDTQNIFCDKNLSCDNFKCTQLIDIGQPCTSSLQCQNSSFCDVSQRICSELPQNSEIKFKLIPQQLSLHCKDFEVTKDSKCIESNDLNTSSNNNNLVVFACPKTETCQYSGVLHCNIFNQQQNYAQNGNIPSKFHAYLTSLRKSILQKNTHCPRSLQLSQDCSLITEELQQFQEASAVYYNFSRIWNMPKCLLQNLKYPEIYQLLVSEVELSQFPQETNNNVSYYWILLGAAVVVLVISRFAILKKRKADALKIQGGILPQSIIPNRESNGYEKQSSANVSLREDNKEQLNLERNPTAGKAEQLEISTHDQDNLDIQKKEGLEISVHQNFFSIDGQEEDDDNDKEDKQVESLGDSQSEGDMSYENVFNLEGENVEKLQRKRKRATNRKKIIKKDSGKKYEVVEE